MSTKEQEREALTKIKKIIDSVGGYDSYIGMAFEGAIDDAEDNIKNDFGNSYYVRYRSSQDKINVLMDELASDRCVIERLNKELEEANNKTHELKDNYETLGNQYVEQFSKAEGLSKQLEAAQQEIIQLKAKLYDLICK